MQDCVFLPEGTNFFVFLFGEMQIKYVPLHSLLEKHNLFG